ncbi:MAG: hypothetical protein QY314_03550 [Candidatus Dojkabacteria bacterium]|nr:MAG: hypothetical protein QY314_03550 [Candidatus Dojkabacteria bacterium]
MAKKVIPTKELFHDICLATVTDLTKYRRIVTENTSEGKDILVMHPIMQPAGGFIFPVMTQFHLNEHDLFLSATLQYTGENEPVTFRITPSHGEIRISEMKFMIPEPFLRFSETQLNAGKAPVLFFWEEMPAVSLPNDFMANLLVEKSEFPVVQRILLLLAKLKEQRIVKNVSWIGKQVRDILQVDPTSRNELFSAYAPFDFMKSAEIPRHVLTLFLAGGIPLQTIRDLQSR